MAFTVAALAVLAAVLVALTRSLRHRSTVARDSRPGTGAGTPGSTAAPPPRPSPSAPGQEPVRLKSCPVCLSEYPTQNRFCVRDGAELMRDRTSGPFAQGMICPTCRRGYPFDARFCPEDADELVPYGLYGAASSSRASVRLDTNKICPECGDRHAAAHLFCGQDGTELVVVN